jgi:hypothetical protein
VLTQNPLQQSSLDWFKGKSSPETHGFLPSNIGLSGENFPIIQFYEKVKCLLNFPQ